MTSKFSSDEANRIDHAVARRARRVGAVLLHALAHGEEASVRHRLGVLERRHVRRRRWWRRAEQHASTHLPRCTGEVRSATDVSIRMLPCVRMPRRVSGNATRRNSGPVTLRNAVVTRRAARRGTCSRPWSASRGRCDPRARGCRRRVRSRGRNASDSELSQLRKQSRRRANLVHVLQTQPLRRRNAWTAFRDRGSASMRATCFSNTAASLSVPSLAAFSSSVSGTVPQRKNESRDARSRSVNRYVSFDVVAAAAGTGSTRNRKRGLARIRLHRHLDARLEVAFRRGAPVEELHQLVEIAA